MTEFLSALSGTPVSIILILSGLVFLAFAILQININVRTIKAASPTSRRQILSGAVGAIMLVTGVYMSTKLPESPTATDTPAPASATPSPATPPSPTPFPPTPISPTPVPAPRIYGFAACAEAEGCDGSNPLTAFPPKTSDLYVAWKFENIPMGAHFVRTWAVLEKNQVWVKYDCIWSDPPSGSKIMSLYDVNGLYSGTWEFTITVNDVVLLQERISIQGNQKHWAPAGTRYTCF